jgi:pimeloyl-ACP methyl ester carboxylesterase
VLVHHIFTGSQPVPDLDAIAEEVRAEAATRSTMLTEWEIDSLQLRGTTTNHLPRLGQLRCPTMLIHGEKDAIVPLSCSRAAATALPQARLRIVQDTGHWPHRERPNEFNAFVREFVNNH